jgi:hypothetical protein|tara:strand:+ start:1025 stop:1411 length:387 start_codon:yes stop_codon:yes gene_type:complete
MKKVIKPQIDNDTVTSNIADDSKFYGVRYSSRLRQVIADNPVGPYVSESLNRYFITCSNVHYTLFGLTSLMSLTGGIRHDEVFVDTTLQGLIDDLITEGLEVFEFDGYGDLIDWLVEPDALVLRHVNT